VIGGRVRLVEQLLVLLRRSLLLEQAPGVVVDRDAESAVVGVDRGRFGHEVVLSFDESL
jgi:hypothetical protein